MAEFTGFMHGIGIGGWLTNFKRLHVLPDHWRRTLTIGDWEHFDTYITRDDVANIASMGMDHIRLAFDQTVLEKFEAEGEYYDHVWELLDNFVSWCEEFGINLVLNMHKTIGNDCGGFEKVSLMDDKGLQNRFINVWAEIEKHYASKPDIVFELLNEVLNVEPETWNDLAGRAIAALHQINPARRLIIGSTCWNSPQTLPKLKLYDDPNVIYTWHMYHPHEFTHQRGVLAAAQLYYNRVMPYPARTEAEMERYRDFHRVISGNEHAYEHDKAIDREFLYQYMKPALDVAAQNPDKIFWLGEFGTIRHIRIQDRENYMRDVISICKEHGIAYCSWNYLSTPNDGNRFSLVDDDTRKVLSPELGRILAGKI